MYIHIKSLTLQQLVLSKWVVVSCRLQWDTNEFFVGYNLYEAKLGKDENKPTWIWIYAKKITSRQTIILIESFRFYTKGSH